MAEANSPAHQRLVSSPSAWHGRSFAHCQPHCRELRAQWDHDDEPFDTTGQRDGKLRRTGYSLESPGVQQPPQSDQNRQHWANRMEIREERQPPQAELSSLRGHCIVSNINIPWGGLHTHSICIRFVGQRGSNDATFVVDTGQLIRQCHAVRTNSFLTRTTGAIDTEPQVSGGVQYDADHIANHLCWLSSQHRYI